jgi:hypothetical protein
LDAGAWRAGLDLLAATQGLARGFGKNDRGDATLRRGLRRQNARIVFYSRSRQIFLRSRQIGLAGRGLLEPAFCQSPVGVI